MLYKYRGISNLKYFVDIILNKRLYSAPYFEMNDPMEGVYAHDKESGHLDEDMVRELKGAKRKLRICSLSRDPDNSLMWSHYAEGHRGVAIGIDVNTSRYDVRGIKYDGPLVVNRARLSHQTPVEILTHKLDYWEYEKEVRVFMTDGSKYIDVEVKEVVVGVSMNNTDVSFVKKLVHNIDPGITVHKAKVRNVIKSI